MAAQDGTVVTIDLDGAGADAAFTVTLSRGQSYLVNGGVNAAARSPLPSRREVNLMCGDKSINYTIDWFTLYPQNEWSSSYYTPVPSVANGGTLYTTINYFYNTTANPITILCTNLTSSGSFTVPANGGASIRCRPIPGPVSPAWPGKISRCSPSWPPIPPTIRTGLWIQLQLGLHAVAQRQFDDGGGCRLGAGQPGLFDQRQSGLGHAIANTTIYVVYRGHNTPLTDPAGGKYSTNFVLLRRCSPNPFMFPAPMIKPACAFIRWTTRCSAWLGAKTRPRAPTGNPGLDWGTSVLPFPLPK